MNVAGNNCVLARAAARAKDIAVPVFVPRVAGVLEREVLIERVVMSRHILRLCSHRQYSFNPIQAALLTTSPSGLHFNLSSGTAETRPSQRGLKFLTTFFVCFVVIFLRVIWW